MNSIDKDSSRSYHFSSSVQLVVIFGTLWLLLFANTSIAQPIENGISFNLAKQRAKVLSNIRYKLCFEIPADTSVRIQATEEIYFDWKNDKNVLQIDFKDEMPQHLQQVLVNGKEQKPELTNEHICISPGLLRPTNNKVSIRFVSAGRPMKRDTSGYLYCFFVPAKARECFPCFDQPDLKAKFDLRLNVPQGWVAVSNGPVKSVTVDSFTTTWKFGSSDQISTYLFSFVTGKFDCYTHTKDDRAISFYHRESDSGKVAASLLRVTDLNFEALSFDADYVGMNYPFKKFDFVAIPGFSVGGMEHPGAVFYKQSVVFLNKNAPASQEYDRIQTIGHEVSHMWFGDLVTMKWFNEVWLKEVFANYIGDKFGATKTKNNDFNLRFVLSKFPGAYYADRYKSSDPLMRDLPNLNQAGLAYGEISYSKAPIIMHQLELLMSPDSFKAGIRDYVHKYAGGNADFRELTAQLQKHASENLADWLNVWINKSGRPIFYCDIDTGAGVINRFRLTQNSEHNGQKSWKQQFYISLVYDSNHVENIKIDMRLPSQEPNEVIGKKTPKYIVFNSTGEGYGVFPIDPAFLKSGIMSCAPEMKASSIINLFETMLRSKEKQNQDSYAKSRTIAPTEFLWLMVDMIEKDTIGLILERELKYIEMVYWKLLKPATRISIAATLEKRLLEVLDNQKEGKLKTSIFRTYTRIALTIDATKLLYGYWKRTDPLPKLVEFYPDDWNSLAQQLALRNFHVKEVLQTQLNSNKGNYAMFQSFKFTMQALSEDSADLDIFFQNILTPQGRILESDVLTAIGFLHHPLRQNFSKTYIDKSLNILPELMQKNDVFFAPNWVDYIFDNYQDITTANKLRNYLKESHPDVPELLIQRIRQKEEWVSRLEQIAE